MGVVQCVRLMDAIRFLDNLFRRNYGVRLELPCHRLPLRMEMLQIHHHIPSIRYITKYLLKSYSDG